MTLECCPYCKKWSSDDSMYKSTKRIHKRVETAYFCSLEHAISYKQIHEPRRCNLSRNYVRHSHKH